MPVRRIKPERPQTHPDLRDEIIGELNVTTEPPHPGKPLIIEEETGPFLHITVIWGKWEGMPPEERGRVIMEAYRQHWAGDESTLARITVTLGLTPEEARKLNISY